MITESKVYVIATDCRTKFRLRWVDPASGKWKQKSVTAKNRAAADRHAGKLAAKVDDGRLIRTKRVVWTEFKKRYMEQHVATLALSTKATFETTFRYVDRFLGLRCLEELDAQKIAHLQAKLREKGLAAATVNLHSRNVRAALRWAVEMDLLARCPRIRFAKMVKGPRMKGGHVSEADFAKALDVLPEVVPAEAVASWRFFLRGLWESGLRLSEALSLSWDDERRSRVDLSILQREKLIILGQYEKGRKNRVWPIPPRFVLLLKEVPVERRTGPVFAFAGPRGGLTDDKAVSRMGAKVFKKAGVQATNGEHAKRATLHDLRRSFALRMKRIVRSPLDLQRLMRHEDINTTKDYYVGDDDEHLHSVLWSNYDLQASG